MNDLSRQAIECRVCLNAVLPALGDLVELAPEARALVARTEGQLRIARWRGPWAALGLEKGRIRQLREEELRRPLDLLLLTDRQVSRLLGGKGWALPLPAGGLGRLGLLRPLWRLAGLLKQYLRAPDRNEKPPDWWRVHAWLSLGIALRAVREVGRHDPEARAILGGTPGGLAEFRIGAQPRRARIRWRHDPERLETGEELAAASPDAIIAFRDERVAAAAMQPDFDAAAAVGRGDVAVRGLLPLAEGLSLVLGRVPLYLETP